MNLLLWFTWSIILELVYLNLDDRFNDHMFEWFLPRIHIHIRTHTRSSTAIIRLGSDVHLPFGYLCKSKVQCESYSTISTTRWGRLTVTNKNRQNKNMQNPLIVTSHTGCTHWETIPYCVTGCLCKFVANIRVSCKTS